MFSRVVHLVKDAGIRRLRPNAVAIAARAQSAAA
jgi:hypothetical protein